MVLWGRQDTCSSCIPQLKFLYFSKWKWILTFCATNKDNWINYRLLGVFSTVAVGLFFFLMLSRLGGFPVTVWDLCMGIPGAGRRGVTLDLRGLDESDIVLLTGGWLDSLPTLEAFFIPKFNTRAELEWYWLLLLPLISCMWALLCPSSTLLDWKQIVTPEIIDCSD